MVFRREWGSLAWHWDENCSGWPTQCLYDEQPTQGSLGHLCPECDARSSAAGKAQAQAAE